MTHARSIALLAALAALTGCGSIGEGSTVVSIEIRDASDRPITAPFPVAQCLRDRMIAVATFTDGTRAPFSHRVTWASSDPDLVQVSNGDIGFVGVAADRFHVDPNNAYAGGTLVARGSAGSTVTITAQFVGMTSSKTVEITQPTFRIAPLKEGVDPTQPAPTAYLGPATFQRFGFYIQHADGAVQLPTAGSLVGTLNPVLWRFQHPGNTFQAADPSVAGDSNKFLVPDSTAPHASISPSSGLVRGITADATEYTVQATTSVCEDDVQFTPTTTIRVAPFATTNPLELAHEADINGPGVTANGDLIAGTTEVVKVIANLDTDGDGLGNFTQDLGNQVDVMVTHTQPCDVATDTNCVCDDSNDPATCTKRLLNANGTFLFSQVTDDSAEATIQACFTNVNATHLDDCEEDPADGTQFELASNPLDIHIIPVDLSGANATLFIRPSAPAQKALTYPGQQFDAYGTFTALSGTPFDRNGTPSASATQKITRDVDWNTREQGATSGFAAAGFVRDTDDSFFGRVGSFTYLGDVMADTVVDVNFATLPPLTSIAPPATPVPFKICPSTAGSCSP